MKTREALKRAVDERLRREAFDAGVNYARQRPDLTAAEAYERWLRMQKATS